MEGKMQYKPTGDTQRQGFTKWNFDGHTIASGNSIPPEDFHEKDLLFILNMRWFELRIHDERNLKMTDLSGRAKIPTDMISTWQEYL